VAEKGKSAGRVLVVDDEKMIRELISATLKHAGIECTLAETGQEGLARLKEHPFELLLTDLRMPKMHGYDLIVQAMALNPPPLVIVVSVIDDSRILKELLAQGVSGFIPKPFEPSVLLAYVQRFLKHADTERHYRNEIEEHRKRVDSLQVHFASLVRELEDKKAAAEEGFKGSAEILSRMIEGREYFKGSHSGRVAKLACDIARRIGQNEEFVKHLYVASLLHQIGYIALPDEVLAVPPQNLDAEKREIYRKFPRLGAMLIKEMTDATEVSEIVEFHQERYNGSGYPDGLAGDAIPLGARILSLADEVDETLNGRKTGVRHSRKSALDLVCAGMGTKFDPNLKPAIAAILSEEESAPKTPSMDIPVDELKLRDVVADNVYDANGILLISADTLVTPFVMERIKSMRDFGKMPRTIKVRRG